MMCKLHIVNSYPATVLQNSCLEARAVARMLIGGGGVYIHIFMFCPTSFFSNQIQIDQFEKRSVGQNMNT